MARWLTGVRELTGRFEFGPVGALLDSGQEQVGTLLTGFIGRVIDASALLCLQLSAEETETRSSSSDKDGDGNINITVTQKANEIKNTVGSNTHADTKMQNRSCFMNPWVVGIGVTVIGGILLYIITATIPKPKTIIEKTPEQRTEKADVTQRGGNLKNVAGSEVMDKTNLPSSQQHETANSITNTTRPSRITPEELDSYISIVWKRGQPLT